MPLEKLNFLNNHRLNSMYKMRKTTQFVLEYLIKFTYRYFAL